MQETFSFFKIISSIGSLNTWNDECNTIAYKTNNNLVNYKTLNQAEAEALRMLNDSKPTKETISLKSLDTFAKVAEGQATKIIIPSEIQNITGLIEGVKSATEK